VTAPPDDHAGRRGWRWAVAAGLAGVAASTLTTALAAAVAGRESDLALQPVELALRVGLLLIAPCVGAILAAVVMPVRLGGGGRLAVLAVGLAVPLGPLLVLRLDRVRDFGLASAVLTVGVMVAWGAVGAALAAGWWARPSRRVERTDLPLGPHDLGGPRPADHLEASGEPGPRGPAA
jgi:hypothetical protein